MGRKGEQSNETRPVDVTGEHKWHDEGGRHDVAVLGEEHAYEVAEGNK